MPITVESINALRQKTGAGLLMTKKALEEAGGDAEKAEEILRKKGAADSVGRAQRYTFEGAVDAYIHTNNKTGVLIEVQCETDFVARSDAFKQFTRDLCLQITACPWVEYIDRPDVPDERVQREFRYQQSVNEQNPKWPLIPKATQDKILAGKFDKWYAGFVLLEQPFVRDQSKTIRQLLEDIKLRTRENIKITRFVRFEVGTLSNSIRDNIRNGCH